MVAFGCGSSNLETECLFARGSGVLARNGAQECHARIHDRGARAVFYATRAARQYFGTIIVCILVGMNIPNACCSSARVCARACARGSVSARARVCGLRIC